jgi:uncharacterized protein with HEPN domain
MHKRDDDLLVEDMIDCCKHIFLYTSGMTFNDFKSDRKTTDAVIRNFEVLGEACSRISSELRSSNNHIEWRRMGDFRNVLIHDYFGINNEMLWKIIEEYLPQQFQFLEVLSASLS